jgi:hypothetical protein
MLASRVFCVCVQLRCLLGANGLRSPRPAILTVVASHVVSGDPPPPAPGPTQPPWLREAAAIGDEAAAAKLTIFFDEASAKKTRAAAQSVAAAAAMRADDMTLAEIQVLRSQRLFVNMQDSIRATYRVRERGDDYGCLSDRTGYFFFAILGKSGVGNLEANPRRRAAAALAQLYALRGAGVLRARDAPRDCERIALARCFSLSRPIFLSAL